MLAVNVLTNEGVMVHRVGRGALMHVVVLGLVVVLVVVSFINITILPSINRTIFDSNSRKILFKFWVVNVEHCWVGIVRISLVESTQGCCIELAFLALEIELAEFGLRSLMFPKSISCSLISKFIPSWRFLKEIFRIWNISALYRSFEPEDVASGDVLIILQPLRISNLIVKMFKQFDIVI